MSYKQLDLNEFEYDDPMMKNILKFMTKVVS